MPKHRHLEASIVISLYQEGLSERSIAEKLGCSRSPVKKILEDNEITKRPSGGHALYAIDSEFFSRIDSEAKAYILGLFYADAHFRTTRPKRVRLSLVETDKELLDQVAIELRTDKPIYYIPPSVGRYSTLGQYSLDVLNTKMIGDLDKIGMSNRSKFPDIPKELHRHFIRGYFDGDGCISIGSRVGNYEMFIMAPLTMVESMSKIMLKTDLHMSSPQHAKSGMYKIRISGAKNIAKVHEFLYNEATIFLARKYDKFIAVLGRDT